VSNRHMKSPVQLSKHSPFILLFVLLTGFCVSTAFSDDSSESSPAATTKEDRVFQKQQKKQSPSFQQKKWTGTQAAYETFLEYNYVAPAGQDLGTGADRGVNEHYFDVRHTFMRHTLLAFLAQIGFEFQHMGYNTPNNALLPDRLDEALMDVGLDTRWSEKDLLHIQVRPGFYTDWRGAGWNAFNAPVDLGYTRVMSDTFQWILGFSWNSWRSSHFLGAGGFRWQMTPHWKLKLYLPTPDVEYAVRPNLTLTLGADIRGDSFRMGPHFGDSKGAPTLNNAIVDYQEVRVGPGFSWNVKPLIEINFMTGYMVGRQFDYHDTRNPTLNGGNAPFVLAQVHWLFKFPGTPLVIPQRNRVSFSDIFKYF
jgi:hypothetical protein